MTSAFPVRDRRLVGVGFAIALLVGGSYGVQRVLLRLARDQAPDVVSTMGAQLVPWLVWACLLPLIARFCVRVPLEFRVASVGTYVAAGVVASVGHAALSVVPIGLVTSWTVVNLPLWVGVQQLIANRSVVGVVEFVLIIALLHAVLFHERSGREADARRLLERSLVDAELRALRMQLEPHFLFNTLNAIAAYVRAEPATAESMLRHLSTVLRAVLDSGQQAMSSVTDELALVRAYLAIHQVRMGARLSVRIDEDPRAADIEIPTLLLQPLVENAIVHGAARRPGAVSVQVSVRMAASGDALTLIVEDHGAVVPASGQTGVRPTASTGIGLANTRARLEHVYGEAQRLDTDFRDTGTIVKITLKAHASTVPSAPR